MLYVRLFVYAKEETKETDEMPVFQFNFMSWYFRRVGTMSVSPVSSRQSRPCDDFCAWQSTLLFLI